MDHELAQAVLARWNDGLPVYEGTLYKAAALMGIDPDLALFEARYYTVLDNALMEKMAGYDFAPWEKTLLSAAAGFDPRYMEKTASTYGLDHDELIIRALRERDWTPDLEKIAQSAMPPAAPPPQAAPPAAPQGEPQNPMMAPPQPGAEVQQQPDAREAMMGGGPSASNPVPPSPEGNLDQILQMAQSAQGAGQGGGLPPAGGEMDQPPSEPPSPEEKIQQVSPDLPPENVARYAQNLQQIEQQTGIGVTDPQQIQKIVQSGQKQDKKIIDQAIKDMEQQSQLQSSTSMAQKPAPPPGSGASPDEQSGMNSPESIAKVAAAGRLMARYFG